MDSGRLYIVMEYVPGTDLNTLLKNRGRFTVEETLPLIRQACAGIGYAHRAGLIHCDIKPHNFLISPDSRLKVTDFGIARALESMTPAVQNGVVWGSPQYFSPEQAAGDPPTPSSDVYALGVVFFYMLTGRLPFSAPTAAEIARKHREEPPPNPSQLNPSIPPQVESIVLKILSKEPSQRYRTADQLGRILLNIEGSKEQHTRIPSPIKTDRNPAVSGPSSTVNSTDEPTQVSESKPKKQENQSTPVPLQSRRRIRTSIEREAVSSPNHPIIPSGVLRSSSAENPLDIDWVTIGLGLIALLTVGGLIPLWVWVYFTYFPPTP
jgi:serine/threonine-protein kinase